MVRVGAAAQPPPRRPARASHIPDPAAGSGILPLDPSPPPAQRDLAAQLELEREPAQVAAAVLAGGSRSAGPTTPRRRFGDPRRGPIGGSDAAGRACHGRRWWRWTTRCSPEGRAGARRPGGQRRRVRSPDGLPMVTHADPADGTVEVAVACRCGPGGADAPRMEVRRARGRAAAVAPAGTVAYLDDGVAGHLTRKRSWWVEGRRLGRLHRRAPAPDLSPAARPIRPERRRRAGSQSRRNWAHRAASSASPISAAAGKLVEAAQEALVRGRGPRAPARNPANRCGVADRDPGGSQSGRRRRRSPRPGREGPLGKRRPGSAEAGVGGGTAGNASGSASGRAPRERRLRGLVGRQEGRGGCASRFSIVHSIAVKWPVATGGRTVEVSPGVTAGVSSVILD